MSERTIKEALKWFYYGRNAPILPNGDYVSGVISVTLPNRTMAYEWNRLCALREAFPDHKTGMNHLPPGDSNKPEWEWNGFSFRLYGSTSRTEYYADGRPPRKLKSSFHRFYIKCPECEGLKWIPIGRLHQHAVVHENRS